MGLSCENHCWRFTAYNEAELRDRVLCGLEVVPSALASRRHPIWPEIVEFGTAKNIFSRKTLTLPTIPASYLLPL
ncbi:hypothetical protein FEI14_07335 [Lacticaseibacillus zeae]|uniref:Uncharacterized protein n=1 Tax=Lacticaseibacillus zeae TaxID=57037 RepID=A0A5R8LXT8_LACZE|nr:hypothetical protein FEI14_07335 [Lacticaseibacillus zeae]